MKPALTDQGRDLLPDLLKFGKRLVSSRDIDPVYPVLRELQHRLDEDSALWMSWLYVAWYHLPSALAAFSLCPQRDIEIADVFSPIWPTGIERRGHRDPRKLRSHLVSSVVATGHIPLSKWLRNGFVEPVGIKQRHNNYNVLTERLLAIHGNGRWAVYKFAEILRRVHDFPVEAPDMGMRYSSGPRQGLGLLYPPVDGQGEGAIAVLDRQGRHLQAKLAKYGLELDVEELETLLCNFHSLHAGRYYVGHDIDEMMEQLYKARERGWLDGIWFDRMLGARAKTLPVEYLGEWRGWTEVDKRRMSAYQRTGKILVRKPQ